MGKLALPVLVIIVAICGVLYLNGSLPGFGAGTDLPADSVPPGLDPGAAKDKADAFIGTPAFYTFLVAAGLATLGVMTWRRIGGFGRGAVLVMAAIAATVLVVR